MAKDTMIVLSGGATISNESFDNFCLHARGLDPITLLDDQTAKVTPIATEAPTDAMFPGTDIVISNKNYDDLVG